MTLKIVVLSGPNMNRLGRRRPEHYGVSTLDDVVGALTTLGRSLDITIEHKQSNCEGDLIDHMHRHMDADGVIVNPAGLTLYGRSLFDAVFDLGKPVAVVHISQLYKRGDHYGPDTRDEWRTIADSYVCGLGVGGYLASLIRLHELATGNATSLNTVGTDTQ